MDGDGGGGGAGGKTEGVHGRVWGEVGGDFGGREGWASLSQEVTAGFRAGNNKLLTFFGIGPSGGALEFSWVWLGGAAG